MKKPTAEQRTLNETKACYDQDSPLAYALAYAMLGDVAAAEALVKSAFVSLGKRIRGVSFRGNRRVYVLCYIFGRAKMGKPAFQNAFFSLDKKTRALYPLASLSDAELSAILCVPLPQLALLRGAAAQASCDCLAAAPSPSPAAWSDIESALTRSLSSSRMIGGFALAIVLFLLIVLIRKP